jgi:hypothetical protein
VNNKSVRLRTHLAEFATTGAVRPEIYFRAKKPRYRCVTLSSHTSLEEFGQGHIETDGCARVSGVVLSRPEVFSIATHLPMAVHDAWTSGVGRAIEPCLWHITTTVTRFLTGDCFSSPRFGFMGVLNGYVAS